MKKYIKFLFLFVFLFIFLGWVFFHKTLTVQDAPESSVNASDPNTWLYLSICLLSLLTIISVAVSFYLYRWRKILIQNEHVVVPEQWARYLQKVGDKVGYLSSNIDSNLKHIFQETAVNSQKIQDMINTYMSLQEGLDEKDKEIKRLKNGYDAEIFRKFILRFVRVEQAVDEFILNIGEAKELVVIKRLLEDAFEECGIEKYSPNIGEDYRTQDVSDNPKIELTSNPELEFKIIEIIEFGYKLVTGDIDKIIIPAKVRIYKSVEEMKK